MDNISIDEKCYVISYKNLIGVKPLRIRFDKIDGSIRVYYGTRYLVLLEDEKYDFLYYRIRYLAGVKRGITYVNSYNYAKNKVDSYGSLPLEKILIFRNVVILINSVLNKDKTNYHYNMLLEKGSYELPKNNDNK